MIKIRRRHQVDNRPANFIDLRQPTKPVATGLLSDVIRPLAKGSKKLRRKLFLVLMATIILIGILVLVWPHHGMNVPAELDTNLNFQVYYPSKLPSGYKYKPKSANVQAGILFFGLQNGAKTINVTEQALPTAPPDLQHLQGFKTFDGPFGKAAIGSAAGGATAITIANQTLITINTAARDQTLVKTLVIKLEIVH